MRGHSLVYQQKVGFVLRPAFTIYTVADVTVITDASELIFAGRHARCVGRAEIRVVSARGLRPAHVAVTVVTRLANAREIRGRVIVSADCVSAAVIHSVAVDMVLHTLAHTVAVIAAYADAFVFTVAGRHALRVHVALRNRRAIGRHALIGHVYDESGLAGAFVARAHGVVDALLVHLAV